MKAPQFGGDQPLNIQIIINAATAKPPALLSMRPRDMRSCQNSHHSWFKTGSVSVDPIPNYPPVILRGRPKSPHLAKRTRVTRHQGLAVSVPWMVGRLARPLSLS